MQMKLKGQTAELQRIHAEIEKSKLSLVEKKCNHMLQDLKAATPVRTGFAKESWSLARLANGFAFENTAPYIEELNAGSSKQAPAFFVERVALKYGKPIGQIVNKKNPG